MIKDKNILVFCCFFLLIFKTFSIRVSNAQKAVMKALTESKMAFIIITLNYNTLYYMEPTGGN